MRERYPALPYIMKKLSTFLLALALSPIVAFAADKFPDISHDELKNAISEKKVTLIDVNGSRQLQGRPHPRRDRLRRPRRRTSPRKLPADKGALVVAYCGNEQCGAYAARRQGGQGTRLHQREALLQGHRRLEEIRREDRARLLIRHGSIETKRPECDERSGRFLFELRVERGFADWRTARRLSPWQHDENLPLPPP